MVVVISVNVCSIVSEVNFFFHGLLTRKCITEQKGLSRTSFNRVTFSLLTVYMISNTLQQNSKVTLPKYFYDDFLHIDNFIWPLLSAEKSTYSLKNKLTNEYTHEKSIVTVNKHNTKPTENPKLI